MRLSIRNVTAMIESIQADRGAIYGIAGMSMICFIAALIVPWLIIRISSDYSAHGTRRRIKWTDRHVIIRWALLAGKNLLG